MNIFFSVVNVCSGIGSILALIVLLIKPIREKLLVLHDIRDGQKCQLRSDMLRTYYKHKDTKQIRQYEYENFFYEYEAYVALKGNSFVEKIKNEIKTWEVLS